MDNIANKGVESDTSRGPHRKPRGKQKKPWIIEWKIRPPKHSVFQYVGLFGWSAWSRYATAARRDQAYAVLVKKMAANPWWAADTKYRKVDP